MKRIIFIASLIFILRRLLFSNGVSEFRELSKVRNVHTNITNEIREAVIFSYSLEKLIWVESNRVKIKSAEDVYSFYCLGWRGIIASNLMEYDWDKKCEKLRATEASLDIPEQICIVEVINENSVLAYIKESKYIREYWGVAYTWLKLKKIKGRWIIYNVAGQGKKPVKGDIEKIKWVYPE